MGRAQYYSPRISRFLVSALYHEAKHRKIPMTKLTDELLRKQLKGGEGSEAARILFDATTRSTLGRWRLMTQSG